MRGLKAGQRVGTRSLSIPRLNEALRYVPKAGRFRWRRGNQYAGARTKDGYRQIQIDSVCYPEHHLVWLVEYGRWPETYLRHKDGDRLNNKINNLMEIPE